MNDGGFQNGFRKTVWHITGFDDDWINMIGVFRVDSQESGDQGLLFE